MARQIIVAIGLLMLTPSLALGRPPISIVREVDTSTLTRSELERMAKTYQQAAIIWRTHAEIERSDRELAEQRARDALRYLEIANKKPSIIEERLPWWAPVMAVVMVMIGAVGGAAIVEVAGR